MKYYWFPTFRLNFYNCSRDTNILVKINIERQLYKPTRFNYYLNYYDLCLLDLDAVVSLYIDIFVNHIAVKVLILSRFLSKSFSEEFQHFESCSAAHRKPRANEIDRSIVATIPTPRLSCRRRDDSPTVSFKDNLYRCPDTRRHISLTITVGESTLTNTLNDGSSETNARLL